MSSWLITGCSSGLGRAFAEAVIGAGHNAVVTARNVKGDGEHPLGQKA
jgi:NAD(P)-dependent dehydrogenase (short-subunit alcohol dehydrogenase family)